MQMEHQYKNENLHSIADVLRGTFSLFDIVFHSACFILVLSIARTRTTFSPLPQVTVNFISP